MPQNVLLCSWKIQAILHIFAHKIASHLGSWRSIWNVHMALILCFECSLPDLWQQRNFSMACLEYLQIYRMLRTESSFFLERVCDAGQGSRLKKNFSPWIAQILFEQCITGAPHQPLSWADLMSRVRRKAAIADCMALYPHTCSLWWKCYRSGVCISPWKASKQRNPSLNFSCQVMPSCWGWLPCKNFAVAFLFL